MHPREGWTEEARRELVTRRGFLKQSAGAGLLLGGAGSLLAACSSAGTAGTSGTGSAALPLPRPNHPVTWPIFKGNHAIKSGLAPETGATLKIYNWVAYINQAVVNSFAKKYNCKVQVTTFNTMDEALAKIRSGQVNFDVFMGVTIDVLGPLVAPEVHPAAEPQLYPEHHPGLAGLPEPLLRRQMAVHGAVHHLYDRYVLAEGPCAGEPVPMANPWAMPWQPKYKGKVAILDDYREGISLGLMKNGIFNLNTTEPAPDRPASGQALSNWPA